jgi:hypothetical protein
MSTSSSPADEQPPMAEQPLPPFHLAFPCLDVREVIAFYEGLGCTVGRHNEHAAILGFFGHQIVAHRTKAIEPQHGIYPRHFGVMVDVATLDRIEADLRRLAPDRTTRAHRCRADPGGQHGHRLRAADRRRHHAPRAATCAASNAGDGFVAGAYVRDEAGDPFDLDAYLAGGPRSPSAAAHPWSSPPTG